VVKAEANLVKVERLGNIDVRHRDADDFELHIHRDFSSGRVVPRRPWGGADGLVPQ
jgi:hypothetical protein